MESKENRQRHLQVSMEVNQERESLQQLHRQTVRAASKQQIVEIAKHLGLG